MAATQTRAALKREIERAREERDRLDVVIRYLESRLEELARADKAKPPTSQSPSVRVQTGRFAGKTAAKAARELLTENGKPMTTPTIFDALRSGGVKIGSVENLYRSLKHGQGLRRVGRGLWGLTEWYPDADTNAGISPNGDQSAVSDPSLSRTGELAQSQDTDTG